METIDQVNKINNNWHVFVHKIAMKISFNTPNQDTKVFDGGFYYLVFKGGLEFFI